MASRVVEVLYKLKDLFTPVAKRVQKAYQDLGKSAEDAGKKVEESNTAAVGALGRLRTAFTALKLASVVGAIGKAVQETVGFVNDLAKAFRSVDQAGRRIGGTAQQFLDIRETAVLLGADADKVTTQLERLERQINKAAAGSKIAQERFEALGIDFREIANLDPAERIQRLAGALRAVNNEQEGLAQVARLLGEDFGTGVSRLLQETAENFAKSNEEAKRTGAIVTQEAVQAMQNYDKWTQRVAAGWEEIKSNAADTVAITVGGLVGEQADEEQKAVEALARAQERFNRAARGVGRSDLADRAFAAASQNLRIRAEQLGRIRIATIEANEADKQFAQTSADNIKADQEFTESLEETTDALKARTEAVKANVQEERREYREARQDQISIEKEFQDLLKSVTTEEVRPEDVSLLDVFGRLNQAIAASDRGEFEKAINLAREGGDFLTLLDEKGTETQGTLSFLAKQLGQVATESAKARTEAEREDVVGAEKLQDSLKQQVDAVKAIGEETGREFGQSVVNAAQAYLDANPVAPRVVDQPQPESSGARFARAGSFSDGTDAGEVLRRNVDQQGNK